MLMKDISSIIIHTCLLMSAIRAAYPPETQLWSLCLCSGYYIVVYISETVLSLDVLYRAHSGLYRDIKLLDVSS